MAAPVRIDALAFSDPRIELLGQLAGYSRFEALGRMAHLWSVCTERQLHFVPESVIRGTIGPNGLQLLLDADLAESTPDGVRIRGLAGRIEWYGKFKEGTSKGGTARMANAQRDDRGCVVSYNQSSSPPAPDQLDSSSTPAPSSPLTLTLPLSLTQKNQIDRSVSTKSTPPRSKSKEPVYTPAELASVRVVLDRLSERSGVKYRGGKEHTALIVARLRDGCTEWDLRRVIGYCAERLKWEGDPKLSAYLRPETLFGPQTIAKYLDPARTWAPDPAPPSEADEEPERAVVLFTAADQTDSPDHHRWEEPSWMTS